jgi:aldehyde dehydrogenase (NAD+)
VGDAVSEALASSDIAARSATGSTRMGRAVARRSRRLGRCLLELGGNNGMILAASADWSSRPRITFAAAGRRAALHDAPP